MSEILAPAGDINSAVSAINAGADAIYLGLKQFSARSSAQNFDFDELTEIISYAHAFGVKVYVAMNTLVKESELKAFFESVIKVWNLGADAIIIADIFLGAYLKKTFPQIKLHLSTQAGVCNLYAARLAKRYGFDRVILSRETAFEDIKKIASEIETEVFVQGALCTCFSGQCYLSSFVGGNSGNRGKCKQPCRKKYSIDRKGFEDYLYAISLSDLSLGEDIKRYIEAGVYSFKIEGRMRRPEYVAAAVCYYRDILGGKSGNLSALKRTYNRGNYTAGLAFGQDKSFISSAVQGHIGEFIGCVKVENGKYAVNSDKKFVKGDGFKILRDGLEIGGAVCTDFSGKKVILSSETRLKNGDKAFITTDTALNERLLSIKREIPVTISAELIAGEPAKIFVNGEVYVGETPLDEAKTKALTEEEFKRCFLKTDKYPYNVLFKDINLKGVFLPSSALNALRRSAYSGYFSKLSKNSNEKITNLPEIPEYKREQNEKIAVIATDLNGLNAEIGILKTDDLQKFKEFSRNFKGEKFIYLPPFMSGKAIEEYIPLIEEADGVYSDGIYAKELCKSLNKKYFVGTGLNISNSISAMEVGADYFAISKELTIKEAEEISAKNSFYLSAGGIKVMDLLYCPFKHRCFECDKRDFYTLTDEAGRKFPLRRYIADGCKFELFNCSNLICDLEKGVLSDCTLEKDGGLLNILGDTEAQKSHFNGNYTRGHTTAPIK